MAVVDKDLASKLASVERAIALPSSGFFTRIKTKFFKSSPAEDLMQFLLLYRPAAEVVDVLKLYNDFLQSGDGVTDQRKVDQFVTIFKTVVAPKIFSIPVPERLRDENDDEYRERVGKIYTDPAFGLDYNLKCMRQFKNLFARATAQLQGREYQYFVIGAYTDTAVRLSRGMSHGEYPIKIIPDSPDDIFAFLSVDDLKNVKHGLIAIYRYDTDSVRKEEKDKSETTESKQQNLATAKNKRRITKNLLLGFLTAVAIFIGIGEAGGPFKFALAAATAIGMGAPVVFAVFVAFAAFTVNALLFRADSFASFRDLFLKNRFTKAADGTKLSKKAIAFNVLLLSLAVFAGLVIAVLSFNFSPLFGLFAIIPLISAYPVIATGVVLFISAMTFIGFTGVLSYALMSKYSLQSVKKFGNYLGDLFKKPAVELIDAIKKRQAKVALRNIALLVLNTVAVVTAAGVLGVSVVAATSGMFYSAMLNVLAGPALTVIAGALGTTAVAAIIGVAEIALGTFFVINVFKVINFSRDLLARGLRVEVDKPVVPEVATLLAHQEETIKSRVEFVDESGKFKGTALYVLDRTRNVVVGDGSFRSFAVRCGTVLGATLAVFAGLNAWAFGAGYATTLITHVFVANAFNFITLGAFATMFVGAARYLAQVGYMVASFGGNASAALQAVLVPEKMTVYKFEGTAWGGATTVQPGSDLSPSPGSVLPLTPRPHASGMGVLDSPSPPTHVAIHPARGSSRGEERTPQRVGSLALRPGLGR